LGVFHLHKQTYAPGFDLLPSSKECLASGKKRVFIFLWRLVICIKFLHWFLNSYDISFCLLYSDFIYVNLLGEEKVTEIQRKRHSALDVSFKGRVRKVAKMVDVSDDDTDDYSPCKFLVMTWF
jgi:hypothetical protein